MIDNTLRLKAKILHESANNYHEVLAPHEIEIASTLIPDWRYSINQPLKTDGVGRRLVIDSSRKFTTYDPVEYAKDKESYYGMQKFVQTRTSYNEYSEDHMLLVRPVLVGKKMHTSYYTINLRAQFDEYHPGQAIGLSCGFLAMMMSVDDATKLANDTIVKYGALQ